MKKRKDLLKRVDWELTLHGLEGMRSGKVLELEMLEADILYCEAKVAGFPAVKVVRGKEGKKLDRA